MKWSLIIYMVVMGLQLFLVKLCSKHLSWQTLLIFVWCFAFVVILPFALLKGDLQFNKWNFLAMGAGILAAVGTIIMYQFIKGNDLGLFVPILGLVPVISVILAMIFLNDVITIKKVAAIVLSGIVVFLLNT